jgi:hypothetical protein
MTRPHIGGRGRTRRTRYGPALLRHYSISRSASSIGLPWSLIASTVVK